MNVSATTMKAELDKAIEADLERIDHAAGTANEVDKIQQSEVDRFLASAERLLEQQRRRMLAVESRYEFDRVKLVDGYRVQMRNLEHEANQALRALDAAHKLAMADARKILDALTAMRGG